jgi:hypothetical protein
MRVFGNGTRVIDLSERFNEIGELGDGVVVVGVTGRESHVEIEAMGGGHGLRNGVEVDRAAAGGPGAIENGLGECAAKARTAGVRGNPQALEFPRVSGERAGGRAPGDEAGGLAGGDGD